MSGDQHHCWARKSTICASKGLVTTAVGAASSVDTKPQTNSLLGKHFPSQAGTGQT